MQPQPGRLIAPNILFRPGCIYSSDGQSRACNIAGHMGSLTQSFTNKWAPARRPLLQKSYPLYIHRLQTILEQAPARQETMSTNSLPEHCLECSWLFNKMGACGSPDTLAIFSYISFIPYLLIFIFAGLSLFSRMSRQLKMLLLLVSAYVLADRVVKNLVAMARPEGACKTTYGFPSSHMVVISCYIFEMLPSTNAKQKMFLVLLMMTQGMARVHLRYHCWTQVLGGIVFGLLYTLAFNHVFAKFEDNPRIKRVYELLGVRMSNTDYKNKTKKMEEKNL